MIAAEALQSGRLYKVWLPLGGQGQQVQPGDPALSSSLQVRNVLLRQIEPACLRKQPLRFGNGQTKIGGAHLE